LQSAIEQNINIPMSASVSREESDPLDHEQLEALLRRMAPPETPAAVFEALPDLERTLSSFAPLGAFAAVAGLMTDIGFHANGVRLDWAQRFLISAAHGPANLERGPLHRLLNEVMSVSRIAWLEDPIEDFFTEVVPTMQGDFTIFSGTWEKAAALTENVLAAFEALPDFDDKAWALNCAYSLLKLSDATARRSGLDRWTTGTNLPQGDFATPGAVRLRALAKRTVFSFDDLASLGIERSAIAPFTLPQNVAAGVREQVPGNSAVELQPLIAGSDRVIVAFPANLCTAVRAILIETALSAGYQDRFRFEIWREQNDFIQFSAFLKRTAPPKLRDGILASQFITEESAGRFVHVLHVVDDFDDWPDQAFGGFTPRAEAYGSFVEHAIRTAKKFAENQERFREGMTLLILGGWGRGIPIEFDAEGLEDWPVTGIAPSDTLVFGASREGKLKDIWRLAKLDDAVARQGFELQNANGTLNLFRWWQETDHSLIPQGWTDVTPPAMVMVDHSMLLHSRRESVNGFDRRSVLHPTGSHRIVYRLDPKSELGPLDPIYAWPAGIHDDVFSAVVLHGRHRWWVDLHRDGEGDSFANAFELAKAMLNWLNLTAPVFLAEHGAALSEAPLSISLSVEPFGMRERPVTDAEIRGALAWTASREDRSVRLHVGAHWHWGLHRADNFAEVALAVELLRGIAFLDSQELMQDELEAFVRARAGSPFTRWRHSFNATTALDELSASGLIPGMNPMSISATALTKNGMAWMSRDRRVGARISGKEDCLRFLADQSRDLLQTLCDRVSAFDRKALVSAALEAIQSGQRDQELWRRSASALRAIHGAEADNRASLKSMGQSLAVIRSATILAEVAAAEAASEGGWSVGKMDMEELQSLAVMQFHTADQLAALHGDRMEPEIVISPTGDVQTRHDLEEQMLERPAARRHEADRASSNEDYLSLFEETSSDTTLDEKLRAVLEAEYQADVDAFFDLPAATGNMAQSKRQGVFIIRRSELIRELEAFEAMKGKSVAALIDRMTLPSRDGWFSIPEGRKPSDFELSKFDRPQSLIGRPIVALSNEPDPELAVAPAVIERCIRHNLGGAWTGSLQNEFWSSPLMRSYTGARGNLNGTAFNEKVASAIESFGLKAWPSAGLPWCLGQKGTDELKALGDADVLAVSADHSVVWVIEAKDLKLCRTRGEVARRLSEYQGKVNAKGKPDKLLRHLRRVEKIRSEVAGLTHALRLRRTPRICGLLVLRSSQPMEQVAHHDGPDATSVMLGDLGAVPWNTGWTE
jgi:hypothetical protein